MSDTIAALRADVARLRAECVAWRTHHRLAHMRYECRREGHGLVLAEALTHRKALTAANERADREASDATGE